MIAEPYNAQVRSLFANTDHAGRLGNAAEVASDDQGVRVALSAVVDGDVIEKIRFRAWGCPHTIAACEAACAALEGGTAMQLMTFSVNELMQSLAVPAEKSARILVIEDTVRQLGAALRHTGTV